MHSVSLSPGPSLADWNRAEIMGGLLRKAGFRILGEGEGDADIVVECGSPGRGGKRIRVGRFSQEEISRIREEDEDCSLLGVHQIASIVEAVEDTLSGTALTQIGSTAPPLINLPRLRRNPALGLIPLSHETEKGVVSYPIESIRHEALTALSEGCRELVLLGDTGTYGTERIWHSSLPEAVKALLELKGSFRLRLESISPHRLKPILDEMLPLFQDEKLYKHLSMPLHSGSNDVLSAKGLPYTVEDSRALVHTFRRELPRATFSTSLDVGHSSETVDEFNRSVELLKELAPDMLRVEQEADSPMVRDRARILEGIFQNILRLNNERWIDWEGDAVVLERGERDEWIARNASWKPFVVRGNRKLGEDVKIRAKSILKDTIRADTV